MCNNAEAVSYLLLLTCSVSDGSIHGRANQLKTVTTAEDSTVHTSLLDQPTQVALPHVQTGSVIRT